jgi:CrcB protein
VRELHCADAAGVEMKLLVQCFWIGAAGFAGALARFGVGRLVGTLWGGQFPLGTFLINVTGSFFLGWFYTFVERRPSVPDTVRLAVATGFVGAYTTFSTWMYESADLMGKGAALEAGTNLLGSLAVGLVAVWLGIVLGRAL